MPDYRRWYVPGGTYFFTVVTYGRTPFLCEKIARQVLRESMQKVRGNRPFEIRALVLLPDHLHTIWTLPQGDGDYSIRWSAVKAQGCGPTPCRREIASGQALTYRGIRPKSRPSTQTIRPRMKTNPM